jgi:hypothetical protein
MRIKLLIIFIISLGVQINSSAQEWSEIQKTLPKNTPVNAADWYGQSIAVENDILIVGAPYHDNAKGCAYVLQNNAGAWETIATLSPQNPVEGDGVGFSVDVFDTTIVIGALGKVLIFNKPKSGWQDMTESSIIMPPENSSSNFGTGVSIEEQTLVIGANTADEVIGKIFIYEKTQGTWIKKATLTSTDATNEDRFGEKVDISGNTVVTGASLDTYSGSYPGSAYIFVKPSTGWEDMTQTAKLTCSDGINENSSLGSSVCISNNTVLVGAEYATCYNNTIGSAYLYEKPSTGWEDMTETAILTPTRTDSISLSESTEIMYFFGGSVLLNDTMAVVGSYWDERNGDYSGSVYVYNKPSTGWKNMTETELLLPSDGSIRDEFGFSVAMDKSHIFVGARGAGIESDEITDAGAVYIFKSENTSTSIFSIKDIEESHLFPNPTKGQVYFNTNKKITNLRLYSASGVLLLQENIWNNNSIDLSSFNRGCYCLIYEIHDKFYKEMIIKY